MIRCVTKARSFKFIDGNILKSCRTDLTDHTQPISHYIMPLVINALRVDVHTHTQTHTHVQSTHTDAQTKGFQETRHTQSAATHTWLKNHIKQFFNFLKKCI